jgi:hypothetical protein
VRLLAFGDELVESPELLTTLGQALTHRDPVELVVHCPSETPELTASVEQAVVSAGLAGDDSPEIVLLAVPDDPATRSKIAGTVGAVYTRRIALPEHASIRHLGATSAAELREAVLRAARPAEPCFLMLTFDSCRYDAFMDASTPVLDSYVREVLPAQTPANFTYAAHHAFFAGMLPHVAETRPYYNRFVKQLFGLAKVGEGELVAERAYKVVRSDGNLVSGFRDAGYQTVGAGAMNWFQQSALTRWFERFCFTDTDAEAQIDFLLREIDPGRPFFGFINFGETHDPFTYKGKVGACSYRVQSRLMEWPPVEKGEVGRDSEAYAHQVEAVEFLDAQLPRLFEALPGHTVVVVCGDHGEAFGEDGYWGHAVNHPAVHEVPMAIFRLDGTPVD